VKSAARISCRRILEQNTSPLIAFCPFDHFCQTLIHKRFERPASENVA
jgi:hypothetical protein